MEQEYPWLIEEKKSIKEFVIDLKEALPWFLFRLSAIRRSCGWQSSEI